VLKSKLSRRETNVTPESIVVTMYLSARELLRGLGCQVLTMDLEPRCIYAARNLLSLYLC
jgi:hypothetical protein